MKKLYLFMLGILITHLGLYADEPSKHVVKAVTKTTQIQSAKNQYIGETEKKRSVLHKAKKQPMAQGQKAQILFFDEADAVKGTVKSPKTSLRLKTLKKKVK